MFQNLSLLAVLHFFGARSVFWPAAAIDAAWRQLVVTISVFVATGEVGGSFLLVYHCRINTRTVWDLRGGPSYHRV